jgi:hypothetical protein
MRSLILVLVLCGCPPNPPPKPSGAPTGTQVTLTSAATTTVFINFGADSVVQAADWASFCTVTAPLMCNFTMTGAQPLPNAQGKYLNMTLAFDGEVGCNATKAELNVNNPAWYDTLDVSLVDGYSNKIEIDYTPPGGVMTKLGPPIGKDGNEKVFGVFPFGCDICTARQDPPCGIAAGGPGCKSGTQYKPDVLCQFQGAVKGGGGAVTVQLVN